MYFGYIFREYVELQLGKSYRLTLSRIHDFTGAHGALINKLTCVYAQSLELVWSFQFLTELTAPTEKFVAN